MLRSRHWQQIAKYLILLLFISAYGYILNRLLQYEHWNEVLIQFKQSSQKPFYLGTLILLWCLNIVLESKKWQSLMMPFTHLSFTSALQQVLAGNTTAVGSPGRIAEMGGRMLLLPKALRVHAAMMTTVGGILQNIVIITGGIFGFFHVTNIKHSTVLPLSIPISAVILLLLLVSLLVWKWAPDKVRYYIKTLRNIRLKNIFTSLFWTITRYLVFIAQLYAWFQFCGLNISITIFLPLSVSYFFLITLVPSHILIDMGIRGGVAIFLFSNIITNTPLIVMATFFMWLSNVMIPTLLGSIIIIRQKLIKQAVIQKES
ncbi:hypothetical protein [Carboxylicivirga sp. M1479]|uniref:hypothetical protein n=1 Tax=Carboxylicivirga sp. M1479 TaxID=2594476 RepID=UPI001178487E|nr:hypothetical protein [Carboxylicivirga sp. M1479]TRX71266.1 hypothetical protein FNN09_07590 [Carboxylicivirga sp. M1479]